MGLNLDCVFYVTLDLCVNLPQVLLKTGLLAQCVVEVWRILNKGLCEKHWPCSKRSVFLLPPSLTKHNISIFPDCTTHPQRLTWVLGILTPVPVLLWQVLWRLSLNCELSYMRLTIYHTTLNSNVSLIAHLNQNRWPIVFDCLYQRDFLGCKIFN